MKRFVIVLALLSVSLCLRAQQSRNIVIGAVPLGSGSVELSLDGANCDLHYKPVYGASVGMEILGDGRGVLFEAYYSRGTYSGYRVLDGDASGITIPDSAASFLGVNGFWGRTLNARKRIQFPLYAGVGLGYVANPSFSGLNINAGLKARAKLYLTDKIGLYAGVAVQYGFGVNKTSPSTFNMAADGGIVIGL